MSRNDLVLGCEGSDAWIRVGNLSVYVCRTAEGVEVAIHGDRLSDALTRASAKFSDVPDLCECGKHAGEDFLYNGMDYFPICDDCFCDPENVALEINVRIAEDSSWPEEVHAMTGYPAWSEVSVSHRLQIAEKIDAALDYRKDRRTYDRAEIEALVGKQWDEGYVSSEEA